MLKELYAAFDPAAGERRTKGDWIALGAIVLVAAAILIGGAGTFPY